MNGFLYTHGDRPLDGYIIQRAVGRGGFGEVYYALSDAGREVALKALHGYEQIEVRGVSECMNLKSPNLVSIFDIRRNEQGKTFVVMEYVNGPSLKELIDASPAGLGVQKSAFFLREIAKGLAYLHERGIVHRDLKPGNIFYEDGYVKIGDYGLAKAIGVSQHSGQTVTVGTVQYMAPEVGGGRYDRSIDIYALGIVLYEMLTGQVPYLGSSHGEILMKHLMSEPDVTGIEEPFATVIRRAMAKNPADRFASVQEMVEAVFGEEHVRNSVSCFSPDSLTMVAGRVAQKVAVGVGGSSGNVAPPYQPPAGQGEDSSDIWKQMADYVDHAGRMASDVRRRVLDGTPLGRLAQNVVGVGATADIDPKRDPLNRRQRRTLAVIAAVVVGAGAGLMANMRDAFGLFSIPIILLGSFGMLSGYRRFGERLLKGPGFAGRDEDDSPLVERLAFGGTACAYVALVALPVALPYALSEHVKDGPGSLGAIMVGLLLLNWGERLRADRAERVAFGSAIAAGITGFILSLFMEGSPVMAAGCLAGISLASQVAIPFDPIASRRGKATGGAAGGVAPAARWADQAAAAAAANRVAPPAALGAVPPPPAWPQPAAHSAAAGELLTFPTWARWMFLGGFAGLFGLGMLLLCAAGMMRMSNGEQAALVSAGIGCLMLSLFCLARCGRRARFRSWWSGLVRPLLMILCASTSLTSMIVMGSARRLTDDEVIIGLIFAIFPGIAFFVLPFIRGPEPDPARREARRQARLQPATRQDVSDRDAFVALLLACGGFCGVGGLHRFYAGRVGSGILWLVTLGLMGFGTIFDLIMIMCNMFRDRYGLPVAMWFGKLPRHELQGGAIGAGVAPTPAPSVSYYPLYEPARSNPWLSALGAVILIPAFLLGVLMALDFPGLIAAGFPDPSLGRELNDLFGYADWPRLLRRFGQWTAFIAGLVGATILLLARRRAAVAHTGRVVLGGIGLVTGIAVLRQACRGIEWFHVMHLFERGQLGYALETIGDQLATKELVVSVLVLLASIVVTSWPERRERLEPRATENA